MPSGFEPGNPWTVTLANTQRRSKPHRLPGDEPGRVYSTKMEVYSRHRIRRRLRRRCRGSWGRTRPCRGSRRRSRYRSTSSMTSALWLPARRWSRHRSRCRVCRRRRLRLTRPTVTLRVRVPNMRPLFIFYTDYTFRRYIMVFIIKQV